VHFVLEEAHQAFLELCYRASPKVCKLHLSREGQVAGIETFDLVDAGPSIFGKAIDIDLPLLSVSRMQIAVCRSEQK
jgi:hypothetical protein